MKTEALFLLASFAVLAALPALPALIHLFTADASAFIDIPPDRNDDPRHFSKRLKSMVDNEPEQSTKVIHVAHAMSLDGIFSHLAIADAPALPDVLRTGISDQRIVILDGARVIPEDRLWLGDLLARSDIEVSSGSTLRALRCESECLLHPEANVLRWLDARSLFVMGPNRLPPRTTASQTVTLSTGVRFERMYGRQINVIHPVEAGGFPAPAGLPPLPDDVEIWRIEPDEESLPGHKVFDDDVYITADTALFCDVVCHGDLHVGARTRIHGNLKINGDLFLHEGVCIEGHILCQGSVTLDHACDIDGVITTLKHLSVANACTIGREQRPTSVIAESITLHSGVCIYGQIWARKEGSTHV